MHGAVGFLIGESDPGWLVRERRIGGCAAACNVRSCEGLGWSDWLLPLLLGVWCDVLVLQVPA